jgi:hypothetical protein
MKKRKEKVRIIWPCKHTENKDVTHWLMTYNFNAWAFFKDGTVKFGFMQFGPSCRECCNEGLMLSRHEFLNQKIESIVQRKILFEEMVNCKEI